MSRQPPRPPPPLAPAEAQALIALCQAGRWAEAEARGQPLLDRHPNELLLLSVLGSAALQLRRFDAAEARFRRAVDLAPQAAELHFNLGVACGGLARHEEAVQSYRRAVSLKPTLAVAHYNLGGALQSLGRLDEAAAALRAAVEVEPGYAEAHAQLGAVRQQQGQLDEAVSCYRAALAIRPEARAHFSLGSALRSRGQLDEAAAEYRHAIAREPGYADAHNNLGETLWDQGRPEEAVASYRAALAIDADHAEANYNLGIVFYDGGQLAAARPCFERARIRDWRERRLYCLYKGEDYEGFRAGLDALVAETPHRSPFLATLSAHHAANFGRPDGYGFCPRPLDFVHHGRLAALAEPGSALRAELLRDIEHADIAARKQGRLHRGIQSAGNLFRRPEPSFRQLAALIAEEIGRYRSAHAGAGCEYLRAFPSRVEFNSAWYVRMRQGGHLSSHIHETGWTSGVVYLSMPARAPGSEDGSIEFSTDGDGYPRQHENFPRRCIAPEVGDIVLFPSSLFHRTIPFSADEARVCVAFDMAPGDVERSHDEH